MIMVKKLSRLYPWFRDCGEYSNKTVGTVNTAVGCCGMAYSDSKKHSPIIYTHNQDQNRFKLSHCLLFLSLVVAHICFLQLFAFPTTTLCL
ncbi:hypothetical protein ACMD2_26851 [Ananas comosus]|uniref:Uncharacterized protein n=1 Tax=Ananas comosus TaxID=4615 RepID=A0A199UPU5_ANACO|nr:hypothetical protein ACMD2_26851 [Ananas comosus]